MVLVLVMILVLVLGQQLIPDVILFEQHLPVHLLRYQQVAGRVLVHELCLPVHRQRVVPGRYHLDHWHLTTTGSARQRSDCVRARIMLILDQLTLAELFLQLFRRPIPDHLGTLQYAARLRAPTATPAANGRCVSPWMTFRFCLPVVIILLARAH
uniref:Putative secreted protein n=1 Tax=Anopheles darlingi TaxID=43151 RepID=A0A2M4D521_ANODA